MKSFVWRIKEIAVGSSKIQTRTYIVQGTDDYLATTFGTIHKRFVFCFVLVFLSNYMNCGARIAQSM